jgi:hypothetical protein
MDDVDEGRRRSVIVFRRHENDRVRGLDYGTPTPGVIVLTLRQRRTFRFIVERQADRCEIGQLAFKFSVRDRAVVHPLCDRKSDATRAGAARQPVRCFRILCLCGPHKQTSRFRSADHSEQSSAIPARSGASGALVGRPGCRCISKTSSKAKVKSQAVQGQPS